MSVDKTRLLVDYGLTQALQQIGPLPIIAKRAPTTADKAQLGTLWVDTTADAVYCLVSIASNAANWTTSPASGSGVFTAVTVNPGDVDVTAGDVNIAAGDLNVTAGNANIGGNLDVAGTTTLSGPIILDALVVTSTAAIILESDFNGAPSIYLHANGGVLEQILLRADQGTSVTSVELLSDVGGVTINGGLASVNAINLTTADAAGGMTFTAGTSGMVYAITNGVYTVATGTGTVSISADATANTVNIGTGAGAKTVSVGSTNSTSALTLSSGSGAMNIGTVGAKTITIGNVTGASAVVVNSGTGGIAMNTTGAGDFVVASADTVLIDSAGVLELNSSAGVISIGNDAVAQNINIGTGAAARVITIGNISGASGIVLNSGTAGVAIATTGAGDFTVASADTVLIDSAGVLELNSSAGVISIGNDAVAQDINIGTGAAARVITIGNVSGATGIALNAGSAGVVITPTNSVFTVNSGTGAISISGDAAATTVGLGTGAAAKAVTVGSTDTTSALTLQSGTGGILLSAAGAVKMTPATVSAAAYAATLSAQVGQVTLTGQVLASAATQVLTITNTLCTTSTPIFVTVDNGGTNDAQLTIMRIELKAGSFEVTVKNNGAAALNGDIHVNFWLLQ